ncbi:MAG: hypothetical protein KatS3mg081_1484 [Gemmatimonadales bacterium]|nr:Ribosomal-protein-alanine acetyltransferase [bacterium HR33]GIW52129.1 MAG: hypothetical protein KatS3mg081_1484 [Gemmatimonadales bacterium]
MTLRIGAARARDRDRVAEIVSSTGVFRAAEGAVALEVFDSAVERPGVDYFALGAFDEADRLVGFACYGPTPCTLGTWDLYWIAVDPAYQRQGTGRALMEACERAIERRGGRMVVVETSSRPDYGPTRAFYRKLGYRETARIPDFYAPGDDLVVYVKPLTPSGRDRVHG